MAGRLDASRVTRPFNGEGDVSAWLAKVELVASLTEVKDVAKFVPLYLEGGALSLYLELDDSKKGDYNLLSKELLKAYSDSEFVAFSKLKNLKWTGEQVDVYANDIRKLARGCGLKGKALEQLVKLTFITGFPDSISVELQQIHGVENMTVSDVIGRARILAASSGRASSFGNIVAVASRRVEEGKEDKREEKKEETKEFVCHRCGQQGHGWRQCSFDYYGKKKEVQFAGVAM